MKYMIIILIIIIIRLGQILLSYIANTSNTHTCVHTDTPPSPFRLSRFDGSLAPNRDAVTTPFRRVVAGRGFIQINTRTGDTVSASLWVFFAYKNLLGRTETRTRDRICFQSLRTVWDISWDDWARIATCSLRTAKDLRRIIV